MTTRATIDLFYAQLVLLSIAVRATTPLWGLAGIPPALVAEPDLLLLCARRAHRNAKRWRNGEGRLLDLVRNDLLAPVEQEFGETVSAELAAWLCRHSSRAEKQSRRLWSLFWKELAYHHAAGEALRAAVGDRTVGLLLPLLQAQQAMLDHQELLAAAIDLDPEEEALVAYEPGAVDPGGPTAYPVLDHIYLAARGETARHVERAIRAWISPEESDRLDRAFAQFAARA